MYMYIVVVAILILCNYEVAYIFTYMYNKDYYVCMLEH